MGGNVEKHKVLRMRVVIRLTELQRLLGKVAEFPQTKMGLGHIWGHVYFKMAIHSAHMNTANA